MSFTPRTPQYAELLSLEKEIRQRKKMLEVALNNLVNPKGFTIKKL
jgi:hypothetical protein